MKAMFVTNNNEDVVNDKSNEEIEDAQDACTCNEDGCQLDCDNNTNYDTLNNDKDQETIPEETIE